MATRRKISGAVLSAPRRTDGRLDVIRTHAPSIAKEGAESLDAGRYILTKALTGPRKEVGSMGT